MSVPEDPERFHAGAFFPASTIAVGAIMCLVMLALDIFLIGAALTVASSAGRRGTAFGAVAMTVVGYVIGLAWLRLGINAARPILLDARWLHLPVISLRHGVTHAHVPREEVTGVEMTFHEAARSSRWQLSVVRRHGRPLTSDSLTCARTGRQRIDDTPAARATERLRRSLQGPARP